MSINNYHNYLIHIYIQNVREIETFFKDKTIFY